MHRLRNITAEDVLVGIVMAACYAGIIWVVLDAMKG